MTVPRPLEPLDIRVTSWMARHGIDITRLALGSSSPGSAG
jgi:hypothetical protein